MEYFKLFFRLRHISQVRLWKNTLSWLIWWLDCRRYLAKYTSARFLVQESICLRLCLRLALGRLLLCCCVVLSVQEGLSDFPAALVLCMRKNGATTDKSCWHLVLGSRCLISLAPRRCRSNNSLSGFLFATSLLKLGPRLLLMLFHSCKAPNA
jgi:hypothetical protein